MQRTIEIAPGIHLTGDGLAWIPGERAIVAADVHVGYELAAQRRGGFLPVVARGAELGARLAALARRLGATRIVIAGDLRHSTRDADAMELAELRQLAEAVGEVGELEVVPGNHDRGGALVGLERTAPLRLGPVDVVHLPPRATPVRFTVCGHLHPRVTMRDPAGASARFSCALLGERTLVLPAFSEWAGGVEASRLVRELAPGPWRVFPMVDGLLADLGSATR